MCPIDDFWILASERIDRLMMKGLRIFKSIRAIAESKDEDYAKSVKLVDILTDVLTPWKKP